ncbi:hypothetical protein J6590_050326 [Homalodisca vitripennis]|nr:hypothetical protein J6590_050326 [Homalodisca vitripennis]
MNKEVIVCAVKGQTVRHVAETVADQWYPNLRPATVTFMADEPGDCSLSITGLQTDIASAASLSLPFRATLGDEHLQDLIYEQFYYCH